jgi:hypothetical protein
MDAKPLSIARLFKNSGQYVIPVFQRHYVWDRENQWEALWEDILSQARSRLDGAPKPHYCGAIVLDQKKQQGIDELPRFDVIDGQQRLTTFQVILAAMRDVAQAHALSDQLKKLVPLLVNQNFTELANPQLDQFKLRPTRYDQEHFKDTITFGDREKLRQKYAPGRSRTGSTPTPKIAGAYLYFFDKLNSAVSDREDIFGSDAYSEEAILEALIDSFIHFFQAVQIILDSTDDAQIIFESLNSRGTPLLASDLMRNRIFLRAEQDKEPVDRLFDKYWARFEERFWTQEEKQGRLKKPRLEFFMVNVLSARTASDVHHNKIYQEYLSWLSGVRHTLPVEAELSGLSSLAEVYRTLIEADGDSQLGRFGRFLNLFDVSTVYPLVMAAWTEGPADEGERAAILADLESYLIRRLICRRTSKNYNKLFLAAIKELRPKGFAASELRAFLLGQASESGDWPSDSDLKTFWLGYPAYGAISSPRLVYILKRIEQAQRSRFSEDVTINSPLTVEHILPRQWFATWPLKDGSFVDGEFARDARQHQLLGLHLDPRGMEAAQRENLIDTFGNLTLLTSPLNASVSNGPFASKKASICDHSALRLNRYFNSLDSWGEGAILKRGEELLADAISVWSRPSGP